MAHTTSPRPKCLRALVLDADAASLRSLVRSLEARCFSVLTASDGTRGLDLLLEELLSLDVVVIDAALPHRDARAFAELIRRAGGERDLAIVALAREAAPELRETLLALGVDAVVERSAGPESAAAAAVGAVAARGSRTIDLEAAPAVPSEPDRRGVTEQFELPFAARWSLLLA